MLVRIASNKKEMVEKKWYYMIIIALVIIIYSLNYFNNTFPYSEGWFVNYAELVNQGKFPYRDFYYYLPPLNLFLDFIFWKLSFGFLLIFRAWYLLERIVLYILVYKLCSKFWDKQKALLATCFSAILCTADDFDFFGDYNQNVALLTVIITFFAIEFIHSKEKKIKLKNLFISGIVLGLMLLTKQTILIACGLVFMFLLILFCVVEKDKNFVIYLLATIIGFLIPVLICVCILLYKGAFIECINQLFLSVEGKGSLFDILITYFFKTLKRWDCWGIALLLLCIVRFDTNNKDDKNKKNIYLVLMIFAIVLFILNMYTSEMLLNYFSIFFKSPKIIIAVIVAVAPCICMILVRILFSKYYSHRLFIAMCVWGTIVICISVMFSQNMYHSIYETRIYNKIQIYFNSIIFYFAIILFIYCLIMTIKGKMVFNYQKEMIMLLGGGLALNYATTMAAGIDYMASNSMRITLPFALVFIFSNNTEKNSFSRCLKYSIALLCIVGITSCIAQKSIVAYPWWGMKDRAKEEKIYTVDNRAFKGITFSKEDKDMYENIIKLIDENTDEDDIIFGYPYIKIYNILCDRYNTYYVPVFWFDVIGDKYVDILIDELNERLPDIVIWYDIPNSLETHESIYRNGKPLEQRKIVDMFNELLPEKYSYLGTYNEMAVYKLK